MIAETRETAYTEKSLRKEDEIKLLKETLCLDIYPKIYPEIFMMQWWHHEMQGKNFKVRLIDSEDINTSLWYWFMSIGIKPCVLIFIFLFHNRVVKILQLVLRLAGAPQTNEPKWIRSVFEGA